ncbi:DDHD domain-containing protein [Cardiosporidium cionae]|uniref:DDHD domain-containing protein n=1 Tax=Cardiosporidium cionae TaxID=476202 RepID=A0ABQ7JDQ5_9APIC|nr:DDHD domain-containing protein [Cardiosporidium cionae]|eukprot:KAF8822078.1 DDHD domain-containing protein [Cardiosporidium cionae]
MSVDHILFLIHGIGSTEDFEEEKRQFGEAFKAAKEYCFWDVEVNVHIAVIEWKSAIFNTQKSLLQRISASDGSELKQGIHFTVNDLFFYLSAEHGNSILTQVVDSLNAETQKLKEDPSGKFNDAKISILGYSLGSVIGYELLTQPLNRPMHSGSSISIPKLNFAVENFFSLGSPIALFVSLFSSEYTSGKCILPPSTNVYNIFFDFDPVAFRLEGLIYSNLILPPPQVIPDWMNNGAKKWLPVHTPTSGSTKQETNPSNASKLKGALDVGVALAGTFWNNRRSTTRPLESQVRNEITDLPVVHDDETAYRKLQSINTYDQANFPIRYDYKLQGEERDKYLSPLAILKSHFLYWTSKDVCRFILKCITRKDPPITYYGHFVELATKADTFAENVKKQGYMEEYYKQKAVASKYLQEGHAIRNQAEKSEEGISLFGPLGLFNRFINSK